MRRSLFAAAVVIILAAVVRCATADESTSQYPMFSLARLNVGLRGEYEWDAANAPTVSNATSQQFRSGVGVVYSLVPHFAAIGRVTFALDASPRYTLGVNWEVFNGHAWAEKQAAK